MENKRQLIDVNDVYELFDQTGRATLHVADIDTIPRVDAVEVVHGRWEKSVEIQTDTSTLYDDTCSVCSIVTTRESPYCPNCGAKMDLED